MSNGKRRRLAKLAAKEARSGTSQDIARREVDRMVRDTLAGKTGNRAERRARGLR